MALKAVLTENSGAWGSGKRKRAVNDGYGKGRGPCEACSALTHVALTTVRRIQQPVVAERGWGAKRYRRCELHILGVTPMTAIINSVNAMAFRESGPGAYPEQR